MIFIIFLADFFAQLSYLIVKGSLKLTTLYYSTTEAFFYSNTIYFILLFIFSKWLQDNNINLFSFKTYLKSKKIILATFLSVFSTIIKTILISKGINQLMLKGYSSLSPIGILFLCHLFLKQDKIKANSIPSMIIVFLGFLVFIITEKMTLGIDYSILFYICVVIFSETMLKSVANSRSKEMIVFDNLFFVFISIIIFSIAYFNESITMKYLGVKVFDINKILSLQGFLLASIIGIISFFAHNFKMMSYKKIHISNLILISLSIKNINAIIFTFIGSYLFEAKAILPSINQLLGIIIMIIGTCHLKQKA